MQRKRVLTGYIILLIMLIGMFSFSLVHLLRSEEVQGFQRQHEEEKAAELFLQDIKENSRRICENTDEQTTDKESEASTATAWKGDRIPADQVDLNYTDDNYEVIGGVKYTPDYAAGHLDCVLEIPKIKMRRGVYTGTASEIQHDLDIWMTTTAHTDYVLGETHYCIYGHNSPTQSLSFNDLKHVGVGDIFLLTTEDYVYLYDVTDFYPQWRELVKKDITDNFPLPAEKCFIITCGRDQYRYKDIIIEGTLREKYTTDEWFGTNVEIRPKEPEYLPANIVSVKEETTLSISLQGDKLHLYLETGSGRPVQNAELCIADSDGLFLKNAQLNLVTDHNGTVEVPVTAFQTGVYYTAGTRNMRDMDEYEPPADLEFMIESRSKPKELVSEAVADDTVQMDSYMVIWGVLLIATAVLAMICAVRICRVIYNTEKEKKNGRERKEAN